MDVFELGDVSEAQQTGGERYLQFLNKGSLSLGLYVLPAGAIDTQTPHAEDEVYYVTSGRALVTVAGETRPVRPGSIVYVARDVEHRFLEIEEELSLLVFFAPQHAG